MYVSIGMFNVCSYRFMCNLIIACTVSGISFTLLIVPIWAIICGYSSMLSISYEQFSKGRSKNVTEGVNFKL